MNSPFSLGTVAVVLPQVSWTLWDPSSPGCPHPQGLAVGGCSSGTMGFKHFNDPQTKNRLSRAFDIIGSNVLRGAIRYYWVNDTNLAGGKVHNCVFTRLGALISCWLPPTCSQLYPTTSHCSHVTYKWLQMATVQGIRLAGCDTHDGFLTDEEAESLNKHLHHLL